MNTFEKLPKLDKNGNDKFVQMISVPTSCWSKNWCDRQTLLCCVCVVGFPPKLIPSTTTMTGHRITQNQKKQAHVDPANVTNKDDIIAAQYEASLVKNA